MNQIVRKAGFDTWTGKFLRNLRRRHNGQCINIFTYHSISPNEHFWTAGTSLRHEPVEFERHMDFIAENYRPIRLSELVELLEAGEDPQKAVVVTIDDGTADALHFAAPI